MKLTQVISVNTQPSLALVNDLNTMCDIYSDNEDY